MSRLDRKHGRFSVDYETNEINNALANWQPTVGTVVAYYRLDRPDSVVSNIYDEGDGTGKAWRIPYALPVMHATHEEGPRDDDAEGFYSTDSAYLTAAYDELTKMGMDRLDIDTMKYLRDRFVYDDKVFKVNAIRILGQVQNRDIVVGIDGVQVKPDELVNDAAFKRWSA